MISAATASHAQNSSHHGGGRHAFGMLRPVKAPRGKTARRGGGWWTAARSPQIGAQKRKQHPRPVKPIPRTRSGAPAARIQRTYSHSSARIARGACRCGASRTAAVRAQSLLAALPYVRRGFKIAGFRLFAFNVFMTQGAATLSKMVRAGKREGLFLTGQHMEQPPARRGRRRLVGPVATPQGSP